MRQFYVCVFVALLFLTVPLTAGAEPRNAIGFGIGLSASCARVDFAGRLSIYGRALDYVPLELEINYGVGRGGMEIMALLYLLQTRYFSWHILDLGIYFAFGTVPYNNIDLDRDFDIVIGTGFEVPVWNNLVFYLNFRFYMPNPAEIMAYSERRQIEELVNVVEHIDIPALLTDYEAYVNEQQQAIAGRVENDIRRVFEDLGRGMVISAGVKYYIE